MGGSPTSSERVALIAEAYRAAVLAGDPRAAERIVGEAIEAGMVQAAIDDLVIAPAMRSIGDMWERGEISVADEHLATEISFRVLALQREAFRVARDHAQRQVVLAGVEDEHHVLGLEMAGRMLAQSGFEVRFLGADLPVDTVAEIARRLQPDVFGFTATMPSAQQLLPAAVEEVHRGAPGASVIVGGQGVPEDLPAGGWVARVSNVAEVVESVDALLHRPSLN